MIVGSVRIFSFSQAKKRVYQTRRTVVRCDTCGVTHIRYIKDRKKTHHFCGSRCEARSEHVQKKRQRTCQSLYGTDHPLASRLVRQKIVATYIKKYGVRNPSQSIDIKEKKKKTCQKNFGVDYPIQSCVIRKKMRMTNLERFGVEHPSQSDVIMDKIRATNLERFGVEYVFQTSRFKSEFDYQLRNKKRNETLKKRGTFNRSMIEDRFYDALCAHFGSDDVERQIIVNGWSIDFFIRSIDTYVQFDGDYYHGLDRPIEEIRHHVSPTDVTISRTYDRDREQERWFGSNGLRLIRIRESMFRKSRELPDLFIEQLHSDILSG